MEKASDKYKFTLLDTGVTIPYTVNKKSIFENLENDSSLVASALEGDTLRSRTGFAYRGKGLPDIRESVFCGFVDKMNIISRKACCQLIYGKNLINKSELGCPLRGTLYYWELLNKEVQNDIN